MKENCATLLKIATKCLSSHILLSEKGKTVPVTTVHNIQSVVIRMPLQCFFSYKIYLAKNGRTCLLNIANTVASVIKQERSMAEWLIKSVSV